MKNFYSKNNSVSHSSKKDFQKNIYYHIQSQYEKEKEKIFFSVSI